MQAESGRWHTGPTLWAGLTSRVKRDEHEVGHGQKRETPSIRRDSSRRAVRGDACCDLSRGGGLDEGRAGTLRHDGRWRRLFPSTELLCGRCAELERNPVACTPVLHCSSNFNSDSCRRHRFQRCTAWFTESRFDCARSAASSDLSASFRLPHLSPSPFLCSSSATHRDRGARALSAPFINRRASMMRRLFTIGVLFGALTIARPTLAQSPDHLHGLTARVHDGPSLSLQARSTKR